MNNAQIRKFARYYLPLFLWLSLIFYLSSIEGSTNHKTVSVWFYIERKGAHIAEYFILTLLLLRIFVFHKKINKLRSFFLSISISLLWAFSDEFHQRFVFGREGKLTDVIIDSIGILLAVLFFLFIKKVIFAKEPKK